MLSLPSAIGMKMQRIYQTTMNWLPIGIAKRLNRGMQMLNAV